MWKYFLQNLFSLKKGVRILKCYFLKIPIFPHRRNAGPSKLGRKGLFQSGPAVFFGDMGNPAETETCLFRIYYIQT